MLNITNRKLPKDFDEKHELYVLDTLKTPKATQILKKWMVGFFIATLFETLLQKRSVIR